VPPGLEAGVDLNYREAVDQAIGPYSAEQLARRVLDK